MDLPLLFCEHCRLKFLPPKYACPQCLRDDLREVCVRGTGTIYSYTTIFSAPERLASQVPYHVILVEMDEGPRVTGRLVAGEPHIHQKVELDTIEEAVYWFR